MRRYKFEARDVENKEFHTEIQCTTCDGWEKISKEDLRQLDASGLVYACNQCEAARHCKKGQQDEQEEKDRKGKRPATQPSTSKQGSPHTKKTRARKDPSRPTVRANKAVREYDNQNKHGLVGPFSQMGSAIEKIHINPRKECEETGRFIEYVPDYHALKDTPFKLYSYDKLVLAFLCVRDAGAFAEHVSPGARAE